MGTIHIRVTAAQLNTCTQLHKNTHPRHTPTQWAGSAGW